MKNFFFSVFIISICFSFQKSFAQNCDSNPPNNLSVSNITSCSATFNWSNSNNVKWVKISYRITGGSWSTWIKISDGSTNHTYTNLLANTSYDFRVFSKCADGTKSAKVKITASTLLCTLPSLTTLVEQKTHSLEFSVAADCDFDSVHIKYSTLLGTPITVSFPVSSSYTVEGLELNTKYLFQFSTCPTSSNLYTAIDTFSTSNLPNIIFILIDDARNDYLSIGGAPPFFQTPNIDRIGYDGVDFRNAYVATSLCAPSRATIATGLFTLKTGVGGNAFKLNESFYTVPEVLGDNGYYTALVGKNHGTFVLGANAEFDYYMASSSSAGTFNLNGTSISLPAAYVLSVTDTAIGVINKTTDPLFMWLAYRVPHTPHVSLPGFEHDYDTQVIPWGPDTAKYSVNYPSTLYPIEESLLHGYRLDTTYRNILEDMAGLDSCIGEVLKTLETTGKLDNTLIIFTSDNGYMEGTHWLGGKTYSFEPSMRVPLLLRYPKWFPDSSVVTNELASNMDIASTIYEAAEIPSPPATDGISLHKLFTGEEHRKSIYYFMQRVGKHNPTERAYRDLQYKYIRYSCDSSVELFFDMVNDPLELTNQINNSAFAPLIDIYRAKFDSMQLAWFDTSAVGISECYIENPFYLREAIDEEDLDTDVPLIYPTIITNYVELYIPWKQAKVSLLNEEGKLITTSNVSDQFSRITLPDLLAGMYFLKVESSGEVFTMKLIKQ
jgi:N-acetylglucosamine-6-sulfatase